MNVPAGMTTDDLPGTMSVTRTVPEPDGLRTVIWSPAPTLRSEPGTPPKQTAVTPPRAWPVMTTSTPPVPLDGDMADTDRWTAPSGPVEAFGLLASGPVGRFGLFPDGETEERCGSGSPTGREDEQAKPPQAIAIATNTAGTVGQTSKPPTWLDQYFAAMNTTRP